MKLGSSTSASPFDWRVCAGGALPLAVGDVISTDIETTRSGERTVAESLTIERISNATRSKMTLSKSTLNATRPLASKPSSHARGMYRTAPLRCTQKDPCDDSWLPATLNVQFGNNQLNLGGGDHARLGDTSTGVSLDVRVVRARARFVAPRSCPGDKVGSSEIHSVAIVSEPIAPSLRRAQP